MDSFVGAVASEQRLSKRLIEPYLREAVEIGASGSHKVLVLPTKPLDVSDTQYTFEFPVFGNSVIDLKGTLLYVCGKVKKKGADGSYADITVETELFNIACNTLHSLFESVSVTIGNNQVNLLPLLMY